MRRKFGKLLCPFFIVSGADVFQVIFEKSAVLILVKKTVLPGTPHRVLHLLRKHCCCFFHLSEVCRNPAAPLLFCWLFHSKSCDISSHPLREALKTLRHGVLRTPIFAKEKPRNAEREACHRVTSRGKGAKYGTPDFSRSRNYDGAVRADHRRLPETARMVTLKCR